MNFLKQETATLNEDKLLGTVKTGKIILKNTPDTLYLVFSKQSYCLEYINSSFIESNTDYPVNFNYSPAIFTSLVHPDDLVKIKENLKASTTSLTPQLVSFQFRKIDGTYSQGILKIMPTPPECPFIYATASQNVPNPEPFYDIAYLERLSAVSQMAASVAHEIRNPMTTVRGYLQFFSGKEDFAAHKEQFELVINELDRANLLIKEYLSLNQNNLSAFKVCQLNNIINSMYPLLKADANNLNKDVQISLNNIPALCLDERGIRQLILNMVRNGLEAMKGMKDRTTVSIATYLEEDSVFLTIKDQGPGVARNVLAHIGQTALTTKEQGTGLGLVVSYKIASNHAAKVDVKSTSAGTKFFIKFPLPPQ